MSLLKWFTFGLMIQSVEYVTGSEVLGIIIATIISLAWFVHSESKKDEAKKAERNRINSDPNSKEYQEKYMGLKSLTH